ncbi:MAG TPA: hypothetical protein VKE96_04680 [Vicinamibacterales bacterium]|nr:hypothetical protein [Vicinamibacterales bacterium]
MGHDVSAVTQNRLTLSSRLTLKILPIAFMTFAVAEWMSGLIGKGKLQATVITFSWVVASSQELLTARPQQRFQKFRWSLDHCVRTFGGQIVWLGLPWMQGSHPDAWFCSPVVVPPALAGIGAVLAMCWPLYLFLDRRKRRESACSSTLAAAVVYCCFFLVSGHLVFAAVTCVAVANLIADNVKRERPPVRQVPAVLSLCPEASSIS